MNADWIVFVTKGGKSKKTKNQQEKKSPKNSILDAKLYTYLALSRRSLNWRQKRGRRKGRDQAWKEKRGERDYFASVASA